MLHRQQQHQPQQHRHQQLRLLQPAANQEAGMGPRRAAVVLLSMAARCRATQAQLHTRQVCLFAESRVSGSTCYLSRQLIGVHLVQQVQRAHLQFGSTSGLA